MMMASAVQPNPASQPSKLQNFSPPSIARVEVKMRCLRISTSAVSTTSPAPALNAHLKPSNCGGRTDGTDPAEYSRMVQPSAWPRHGLPGCRYHGPNQDRLQHLARQLSGAAGLGAAYRSDRRRFYN